MEHAKDYFGFCKIGVSKEGFCGTTCGSDKNETTDIVRIIVDFFSKNSGDCVNFLKVLKSLAFVTER